MLRKTTDRRTDNSTCAFLGLYLLRLLAGALAVLSTATVLTAQDNTAKTEEPGTDRFYTANELFNRKLFPVAAAEYKIFLEQYPNHSKADQARYAMALSLFSSGSYKEAEPVLSAVLQKKSAGNMSQVALLRGQCLLELSRLPEAEQAFAEIFSSNAAAEYKNGAAAGLTDSAFQQKNWTNTVSWGDKLIKTDPDGRWTERAVYQTAYARFQLGRFEEVLTTLAKVQGKSKDEAMLRRVAFLAGEAHRELSQLPQAREQFDIALKGEKEPRAAEIVFRIGFLQMAEKKHEDAIASFRDVIARKPPLELSLNASLKLGVALLEKGDYDESARILTPVAASESAFAPEATLMLARTWSRRNRRDEAAKVLEPAVTKFARDKLAPDMLFDYANNLMVLNRFADAANVFAQSQKYPGWPQTNDALRLQSLCLHRAGNFNDSLATASDFLTRFPSDDSRSDVLFIKGENLFLLNRIDEALSNLVAFVKANPEHSMTDAAILRAGQVHQRTSAWQDAIKTVEPIVESAATDPALRQVYYIIGDAWFHLEKWDEAITNLSLYIDVVVSPPKAPPPPDAAKTDPKQGKKKPKKQPTVPRNQLSPVDANMDTALMELAVSFQRKGAAQQAMNTFSRLIQQFPQTPYLAMALRELGRMQYEASDLKSARASLERLLTAFPQSPQVCAAQYYLGWIALNEKKDQEADQRFAVVQQQFPRDPSAADAVLQRGLLFVQQEKHKEAAGTFHHLLQNYPDHPRREIARFSMGVALTRAGDNHSANETLKSFVDDYPKSDMRDRAIYELAWLAKALKQQPEAIRRYKQLLEECPRSSLAEKVQTELAELTFNAKDFEKVIADLKASIPTIKDAKLKEQAIYRLGTSYFNSRNFDESAATFESFIKEYPKSSLVPSASFQAGESRMRTKETVLARDHFAAAAQSKIPSVCEPALLRLGETYGLLKQWKESADAYSTFIHQYSTNKFVRTAQFGLGWARENLGDYNNARLSYSKVIGANIKDELAARTQFQVGETFYAEKKYDQALQELARVGANFGLNDWTAKAALEMGRVLEAKGDVQAAMAQFKEVIAKYPNHDAAIVAKQRLDILRKTQ